VDPVQGAVGWLPHLATPNPQNCTPWVRNCNEACTTPVFARADVFAALRLVFFQAQILQKVQRHFVRCLHVLKAVCHSEGFSAKYQVVTPATAPTLSTDLRIMTRCVRSGVRLLIFHVGTWGFSLGEAKQRNLYTS